MPPGFPQASFFRPAAYKDWKFERDFYRRAFGASTVVHLTHRECMDGATCDVLVRAAHGDGAVETIYLEPHETTGALELLTRVPARARALVISDLSLQRGEGERAAAALESLADEGWRISWRDHHHKQWEGIDLAAFEAACDITLDRASADCGSTLVAKDLLPKDDWARELSEVVRDHDLWLRKDPRSIMLFHSIVEAGTERWVRYMLSHKTIVDKQIETWAERDKRKNEKLVKWAIAKATVVRGERAIVGLAFGRVPTNEVLHALEEKGAHLSILIKPSGSFSLRSRKDVPVCHKIAQEFGGGGHPNASGGRLGLSAPSLAALWTRRVNHPAARALARRAVKEVDAHLATQKAPN